MANLAGAVYMFSSSDDEKAAGEIPTAFVIQF
jgi:hypothetical protein